MFESLIYIPWNLWDYFQSLLTDLGSGFKQFFSPRYIHPLKTELSADFFTLQLKNEYT